MTAKRGRSLHTMGQGFVSGLDGGGLPLFHPVGKSSLSVVTARKTVNVVVYTRIKFATTAKTVSVATRNIIRRAVYTILQWFP